MLTLIKRTFPPSFHQFFDYLIMRRLFTIFVVFALNLFGGDSAAASDEKELGKISARKRGKSASGLGNILRRLSRKGRKRDREKTLLQVRPEISVPLTVPKTLKDDDKEKKSAEFHVSDKCSLKSIYAQSDAPGSGPVPCGGFIVNARELSSGASRHTVLSSLYAWENKYSGLSLKRMNIIIDVADIMPRRPDMKEGSECDDEIQLFGKDAHIHARKSRVDFGSILRGEDLLADLAGAGGVSDEVASAQKKAMEDSELRLDPTLAPSYLWGAVHQRVQELEVDNSYYMCPPVTATIDDKTVTFTLAARKPDGKLKFHKAEITRSSDWTGDEVEESILDKLHELEKRTAQVEGAHGKAACEEQLIEYGNNIKDGKQLTESHEKKLSDGDVAESPLGKAVLSIYLAFFD